MWQAHPAMLAIVVTYCLYCGITWGPHLGNGAPCAGHSTDPEQKAGPCPDKLPINSASLLLPSLSGFSASLLTSPHGCSDNNLLLPQLNHITHRPCPPFGSLLPLSMCISSPLSPSRLSRAPGCQQLSSFFLLHPPPATPDTYLAPLPLSDSFTELSSGVCLSSPALCIFILTPDP